MTRPGALLSPVWVWQELQFPAVCFASIAREAPAEFMTAAEYGVFTDVVL